MDRGVQCKHPDQYNRDLNRDRRRWYIERGRFRRELLISNSGHSVFGPLEWITEVCCSDNSFERIVEEWDALRSESGRICEYKLIACSFGERGNVTRLEEIARLQSDL